MIARMPRSDRATSPRGPAFWLGAAMVLAGFVLLGHVAWQLFGTNVVSQHKQRQLVEDTRRSWQGPSGRGNAVALHGAEALVRIPRFGKDYVVPVQAGLGDDVLAEGFGHFPHSVAPGHVGNYAIAAHRVTHGEPLRHLPDLRPGDKVVVETRHRTYVYR